MADAHDDRVARLEDRTNALQRQLGDADGSQSALERRIDALDAAVRDIHRAQTGLQAVAEEIRAQSYANAEAIRQHGASQAAILQAVLDSRQASDERHTQQQREMAVLSERMDSLDKRLTQLETLFPSRAWRWMLAAAAAGIATLTWDIWSHWIIR